MLYSHPQLSGLVYYFSAKEFGAAMLLAMHIAENGRVSLSDGAKAARLTKKSQSFDCIRQSELFVCVDGVIDLNPEVFFVKHLGSDAKRINIPASIRAFIYERDGHSCTYCGVREGPFEVDHIYPVSKGGDNSLSNLCLSCQKCNREKSDKLLDDWIKEKNGGQL